MKKIVICADDDHLTKGNPGVTQGTKAARAINAGVAVPDFGDDRPDGAKDFNDLADAKDQAEVSAQINAVLADAPVEAEVVPPDDDSFLATDRGHARRLWKAVKGDVHYVAERKKFCFYNPTLGIHELDITGGRILASCVGITKQLVAEALATDDKDERKRLLDEARSSEGLRFMKNAVELLPTMPDVVVSSSIFDSKHSLVNFRNGVYDLDSDAFREHRRDDYNTIVLGYDYVPAAVSLLWEKVIADVWPDLDTQRFMQRWIGYCLCGSVKEQKFLFVWGKGANGKSVVFKAVHLTMGDYAGQVASDVFASEKNDDTKRKVLPLKGKRLVITTETQEGQRLDEGMIKAIASPDSQVSRRLYCEEENWKPTAKVVIMGNHLLRTRGGDFATDRRIALVGCEQTFTGERCDPDLLEKLASDIPGIMSWIIEGHRQWKQHGLGVSAKVQSDTAEFVEENDTLAPFFDDVCIFDACRFILRPSLYQAYQDWAQRQGNSYPLSARSFSDRVQERGGKTGPKRTVGTLRDRTWDGLALRSGVGSGHMGTSGQQFTKSIINFPSQGTLGKSVPASAQVPTNDLGDDPIDPSAQLDHCLRARPDTTACDASGTEEDAV